MAYKKEYGWHNQELVGINIRDIISERYRYRFDAYMQRILERGRDNGYLRTFARDGREIVLEYRNKLMVDDDGRPVAVHGAARDVTERIRYEKAIKESEEKYKNIVQYAPAGICEIDLKTLRFTSANDVMCLYTAYSRDEFLKLPPPNAAGGR